MLSAEYRVPTIEGVGTVGMGQGGTRGRDTGMYLYFTLCCCSLYELAQGGRGGEGRDPRSSWVGLE